MCYLALQHWNCWSIRSCWHLRLVKCSQSQPGPRFPHCSSEGSQSSKDFVLAIKAWRLLKTVSYARLIKSARFLFPFTIYSDGTESGNTCEMLRIQWPIVTMRTENTLVYLWLCSILDYTPFFSSYSTELNQKPRYSEVLKKNPFVNWSFISTSSPTLYYLWKYYKIRNSNFSHIPE